MKIKVVGICLFILFCACIVIASIHYPAKVARISTPVVKPAVEKTVARKVDSVQLRGNTLRVGMTADTAFEILSKSDEMGKPSRRKQNSRIVTGNAKPQGRDGE